jgi:hypothetical protein
VPITVRSEPSARWSRAAGLAADELRRRKSTFFYLAVGVVLGFLSFCYPELRMRLEAPEAGKLMWGEIATLTAIRCFVFALAGAVVVILPVFVAHVVLVLRKDHQI